MASRLLSPTLLHAGFRTPLLVAAGVGFSSAIILSPLLQIQRGRPLLLDSSPALGINSRDWSSSTSSRDAKVPVVNANGKLNAGAVKQLSLGSITGLFAGLAVGFFSKPLAIIFGLAVAGVVTAESYGIRLIPYSMLQRYIKGIDFKGAVRDNVALKVSFGLMFALSGFAEL